VLYHHYCCELESCSWRGLLDSTLCDKVCQWFEVVQWFSPGTPVSSTNKIDRHDITGILLTVTLSIITHHLYLIIIWSMKIMKINKKKNNKRWSTCRRRCCAIVLNYGCLMSIWLKSYLSLTPIYWYVVVWGIWENPIKWPYVVNIYND
jgi:hypothetical protein